MRTEKWGMITGQRDRTWAEFPGIFVVGAVFVFIFLGLVDGQDSDGLN